LRHAHKPVGSEAAMGHREVCPNYVELEQNKLTLSNPIFLPPAYSPALIYFWRERGWWITCNYPTFLEEENRNRKIIIIMICLFPTLFLM
jgi:hypothetical protein